MSLLDGIELEFHFRTILVKLSMMTIQNLLFLRPTIYDLLNGCLFTKSKMICFAILFQQLSTLRYYHSSESSIKGYTDDAALISGC